MTTSHICEEKRRGSLDACIIPSGDAIPKYGSFKAAVNHERGKDPVYKTNKTGL